ncbi:HAMP domain-containing sensor histidine kinase [Conexibacter sp. SYSU D00693]|uniref:sensor histidine kinase n=1 Tax=Conexibacter sp. SYSU D00693 TaxID=2812560 RepID=UPI00196A6D58|nr:HAMP domain-containing sensor histidine kinase [Conexibacter sp. SYSU D00693]
MTPGGRRRRAPSVRVRLTALYAGVLVLSTAALLAASYVVLRGQLDRTLPPELADDALADVAGQYVVGLLGATLLAVALGWALAGRALAPIARITATARRISDERLDARVGLEDGPDDELRELAATLDEMLDRLERSFGAQRRFVANASHELRSPLTVIRTEAEVALADPDATPEELREALGHVVEAADRTEELLEALLVLARSHAASGGREPLDLAAAARAAVAAVPPGQVDVTIDAPPAPAVGDRALVERLAVNLVDNAVRYNRAGGRVTVVTGRDGAWAWLRVTNTGPELSQDDATRLTEPFERLGRRAGAGGSGLGLSIVRSVVEAHGGRLAITPRPAPLGGLEVEVRLPAGG